MNAIMQDLPPCAEAPQMYQDEDLLSPPSRREVTANQWRVFQAKQALAHRRCAGCPVLAECLFHAVVEVDVSGFVACTSEADRRRMRRNLGLSPQLSATSNYGTSRVGGGPVSHEAVMAARRAYPDDTCRQLADRLGCSTSTIKRHLRKAREESASGLVAISKTETTSQPTVEEVLDEFDMLESSRSA